ALMACRRAAHHPPPLSLPTRRSSDLDRNANDVVVGQLYVDRVTVAQAPRGGQRPKRQHCCADDAADSQLPHTASSDIYGCPAPAAHGLTRAQFGRHSAFGKARASNGTSEWPETQRFVGPWPNATLRGLDDVPCSRPRPSA